MRAEPVADLAARDRYEAIYRAIRRRSLIAVWLCIGATLAIGIFYLLWLAGPMARAFTDLGVPLPLAVGAQTAVFLAVALSLPNLAQLIVIRGDTAQAFEAFNAWGLAEAERWKRSGAPLRVFRKADQVMPWIKQHPELRGSIRVRLLTWSGAFDLARGEIAEMPAETTDERFERALLASLVDFVATASGDLRPAREALTTVPPAHYDRARLALALEQARAAQHAGQRWQEPLAAARREVKVPRAATIVGRFLSGWRINAGFVAIGALLAVLITAVR